MFGLSQEGLKVLTNTEDKDGKGSIIAYMHDFYKISLGPGPELDNLTCLLLQFLDEEIKAITKQLAAFSSGRIIKLQEWTKLTMIVVSSSAVLGPQFLEKYPNLPRWMWEWEDDFVLLSLGLPRWMLKRQYSNIQKIIDAFADDMLSPKHMPFIRELEATMNDRGMSDSDVAACTFAIWAA